MEPVVGFEPTTDGLQNRCSTPELNWLAQLTARYLTRTPLTPPPPTFPFTAKCSPTQDDGQRRWPMTNDTSEPMADDRLPITNHVAQSARQSKSPNERLVTGAQRRAEAVSVLAAT